jgi:hypothetical protein
MQPLAVELRRVPLRLQIIVLMRRYALENVLDPGSALNDFCAVAARLTKDDFRATPDIGVGGVVRQ